ncbi:hypothetical protein SAMN05880582_107181 [Rhizobium sp. RU20A]|uniref:hypothetical protein n=1 Tax=Rhizobium sp. RU20A TaxID=1907412 RepID=UPI00095643F2|nr:hypothetical protein [Rhizobium sp. RU20A]SIR19017.1 hypothetical protein SAMN05880582_107181 [Rhizobium sp. RU20A]
MAETSQATDEDRTDASPKTTTAALVGALMRLDPGSVARLRRMDPLGPGEIAFWQLATEKQHPVSGDARGIQFVKILALLTPRGEVRSRAPFHRLDQPLGKVLAEAGFSEKRLASFMALPFDWRGEALERIARFLFANMSNGVNCDDIRNLLLIDDVWPLRRLANTYYDAFDRAAYAAKKGETK